MQILCQLYQLTFPIPNLQKLESRKAALEHTNALSSEQKARWRTVLVSSFVSSEESGQEEVEGEQTSFLFVKSLPWREAKLSKFMRQMDEKVRKKQSARGKRQTLPQKQGETSSCSKPVAEFGDRFWGFAQIVLLCSAHHYKCILHCLWHQQSECLCDYVGSFAIIMVLQCFDLYLTLGFQFQEIY